MSYLRVFLKAFGLDWLLPVPFKTLDAKAAHALVADSDTLFIDVREPKEWDRTGRPEYTIGQPMNNKQFLENISELADGNLEKEIVLTCQTGKRAKDAAIRLHKVGHTKLTVVEGGIFAWKELELPITYEKPYI